jgi:hypothetical protein
VIRKQDGQSEAIACLGSFRGAVESKGRGIEAVRNFIYLDSLISAKFKNTGSVINILYRY